MSSLIEKEKNQQIEIKTLTKKSMKSLNESELKYENIQNHNFKEASDYVNEIVILEYTKFNLDGDKHENNSNDIRNYESENKNSNGLTNIKNFELKWKDLEIDVSIYDKKTKKSRGKKILNRVSGSMKSGECLGILGSSGAGKTTLMNYLSMKIKSKNLISKGEILLNGKNVDQKVINRISSYVMQDDILEATMTPLEILMFTAKLKLNLSSLEIEQRVHKMINALHLMHCMNTKVGSNIKRGISWGERKRTSIAVELISDPKIIFLDEPTTGLDSHNAYIVISLLRKLAREGKIIIFTIHQPSSEIFYLLDKISILAAGKTVYFGSQSKCFECFRLFNIPVPLNYNPFEHFLEMTNFTTVSNGKVLSIYPKLQEIDNIDVRYKAYINILNTIYEENKENFDLGDSNVNGSSNNAELENDNNYHNKNPSETNEINKFDNDIFEYDEHKHKNIFYELSLLLGRSILINIRNVKILVLRIAQNLFVALFISALFYDVFSIYIFKNKHILLFYS